MICPSCGTENHEDARFCKACAAPQTPAAAPPVAPSDVPPAPPLPPAPPWFAPRRPRWPHEDLLGLLSLAFVLFAVTVALSQNPSLLDGIGRWFNSISANHTVFVRPPDAVIVSAAWFFAVVGALEFVSVLLRWSLRWPPLHVVSRLLSGIGDGVFAVLLLRYADRAISGGVVITVLVGMLAAFLMIYVTLGAYWSAARTAPWATAPQPPAQQ